MRIFRDRVEAGQCLANAIQEELRHESPAHLVVIALPRGGVPVAFEVSKKLKAPLDVLVTRKIGAPENPEYGIGAVSENGSYWINTPVTSKMSLTQIELDELLKNEQQEIRRRIAAYRHGKAMVDVRGKTVVLVDDGLATGVTARVSVQALKQMGAARVIFAAPVCAPDSARELMDENVGANQVICVEQPLWFQSVGSWYEDFEQTSDDEVMHLLDTIKTHPEVADPEIEITDGKVRLSGSLVIPENAKGLVLFAHGSGSSRLSPRNIQVAKTLQAEGFATLLFDLLDLSEAEDRRNVFDIPLLASRLQLAFRAVRERPETSSLPVAFFGASTGGAAALWAAAEIGSEIRAVISRGGRPDLAMEKLPSVPAATLLIVGGADEEVLELNRKALAALSRNKNLSEDSLRLEIVAGATHLFEEPGTLEIVADLARRWLSQHLRETSQKRQDVA